jgi:hypothetical protein
MADEQCIDAFDPDDSHRHAPAGSQASASGPGVARAPIRRRFDQPYSKRPCDSQPFTGFQPSPENGLQGSGFDPRFGGRRAAVRSWLPISRAPSEAFVEMPTMFDPTLTSERVPAADR